MVANNFTYISAFWSRDYQIQKTGVLHESVYNNAIVGIFQTAFWDDIKNYTVNHVTTNGKDISKHVWTAFASTNTMWIKRNPGIRTVAYDVVTLMHETRLDILQFTFNSKVLSHINFPALMMIEVPIEQFAHPTNEPKTPKKPRFQHLHDIKEVNA